MNENTVDWKAAVLDLERRVALLEIRNYGHANPLCGEALLIRCYLDAHKAGALMDPVACRAWVRQIWMLDVRALVRIGRALGGTFPWRPFLVTLDLFVVRDVTGATEAREHLLTISQDLLNAVGLELIGPRDVMGKLKLQESLAAV
jgi:hypothetical protein